MDASFPFETQPVIFESSSRSGRWGDLRAYLKQLIQILDENSDRLAHLQSEVDEIRAVNLKITETVQELSDAANEEIQREVSLTLNDDNSDVVIDTAPEEQPGQEVPVDEDEILSEEDFINELKKLPGIGSKSSIVIATHIAEAQDENVLRFAYALRAVNADISKDDHPRQLPLNLD